MSQQWVEPSVPVTMSLVNELPPQYSTLAAPCKLKLETSGPLGLKYPDKMGIYHLLTNTTYYGSPAWKKNDETYLKKDEEGTWVVSKVNLTQNIFFWQIFLKTNLLQCEVLLKVMQFQGFILTTLQI